MWHLSTLEFTSSFTINKFYAYAGNNPVNANDPTGTDINFQGGALNTLAPAFNNISNTLAGRDLIESLDISPATTTFSLNNAGLNQTTWLPGGNGAYPGANITIDPNHFLPQLFQSADTGTYLITTPSLSRVLGHELGHTDPANRYDINNDANLQMNNVNSWENPLATPNDGLIRVAYPSYQPAFNQLLNGNQTAVLTPQQGQSYLSRPLTYDPTTGTIHRDSVDAPGADGGFLLYPNKPNNNSLQGAYSK